MDTHLLLARYCVCDLAHMPVENDMNFTFHPFALLLECTVFALVAEALLLLQSRIVSVVTSVCCHL